MSRSAFGPGANAAEVPSHLLEPGAQQPKVGRWPGPVLHPNLEQARIAHLWDGLPASLERVVRSRWRLKRWQFVSCHTPGWMLAVAVADAGYAGNAFVYAVNLQTGEVRRLLAIQPFGRGVHVARSSHGGQHRFEGRGAELGMDNLDGGRTVSLRGRGRFDRDGGAFELDLHFRSEPADRHFGLCVPLPTERWGYTHKFGGFRVSGWARIDGQRLAFDPAHALGHSDFSCMYAPRHMVWRWVSVAQVLPDGRRFALNLVQPAPGGRMTENMLWLDGQPEPVFNACLEVDARGWRAQADGLQLHMQPVALYRQALRVPLLSHRLDHHVGLFNGFAETSRGRVELRDAAGIAEDNDSWW